MPWKAKVPCRQPGCSELVKVGERYCEKHKKLHAHDRPTGYERGYDYEWRKFRKQYLKYHPLCVECTKMGRLRRATDVDHIKPLRDHPELKYDESNLQALCHSCHSRKTRNQDWLPTYRY